MGKPSDLVQGTLDLLILKTLSLEPKHGWAIAKRIQQISNGSLGRYNKDLFIRRCTGWSSRAGFELSGMRAKTGRQAKFYSLTAAGPYLNWKRKRKAGKRLSTAIDVVVESL